MLSTHELFECVFPNGLSEDDYAPLVHVLLSEMSIRAVAAVLAELRGGDDSYYFNDILGIKSQRIAQNIEKENQIQARLTSCGWTNWLDAVDFEED
jgi:hypothetical protein